VGCNPFIMLHGSNSSKSAPSFAFAYTLSILGFWGWIQRHSVVHLSFKEVQWELFLFERFPPPQEIDLEGARFSLLATRISPLADPMVPARQFAGSLVTRFLQFRSWCSHLQTIDNWSVSWI
jgi:hypothetical protein